MLYRKKASMHFPLYIDIDYEIYGIGNITLNINTNNDRSAFENQIHNFLQMFAGKI